MSVPVATAIVAGSATVAGAFIAACLQYISKAREERRLAQVSQVEADTRVAASFTTLMSKAHARGDNVLSEAVAEALLADGPLVEQIRSELTSQVANQVDWDALGRIDQVLDTATVRTYAVGTAEQEAAIQVVVALGLQHAFLTRAARVAVERRHAITPVDDYTRVVKALEEREQYDSRRFRRGRTGRAGYWLHRQRT